MRHIIDSRFYRFSRLAKHSAYHVGQNKPTKFVLRIGRLENQFFIYEKIRKISRWTWKVSRDSTTDNNRTHYKFPGMTEWWSEWVSIVVIITIATLNMQTNHAVSRLEYEKRQGKCLRRKFRQKREKREAWRLCNVRLKIKHQLTYDLSLNGVVTLVGESSKKM